MRSVLATKTLSIFHPKNRIKNNQQNLWIPRKKSNLMKTTVDYYYLWFTKIDSDQALYQLNHYVTIDYIVRRDQFYYSVNITIIINNTPYCS